MGEMLLNGRQETAGAVSELPDSVIRRAGQQLCGKSRDLLAGILAEEPPEERVARPLADVVTGML
jgi:hypothetical protein